MDVFLFLSVVMRQHMPTHAETLKSYSGISTEPGWNQHGVAKDHSQPQPCVYLCGEYTPRVGTFRTLLRESWPATVFPHDMPTPGRPRRTMPAQCRPSACKELLMKTKAAV